MAGVDNRIVTMKFDNREFEQNAKTSLTTLQKLKESMSFGSIVGGTVRGLGAIEGALSRIGLKTPFAPLIRGANAGLGMIGNVMDRLGMRNPFGGANQGVADLQQGAGQAAGQMGVLQGAVTGVSGKFIALSTIAITALSNITNRAINAGTAFAKSFTFAPVMQGLHEYELNLKSIQTVQANTDRPLTEINASLDELNKYSDQTIYNFAEMAKNVGTFTAAGVDLETSVSSIKGIANLAALSGSSSEQAAGAMYQLSQAIASGKVGLMDWNSVVNAGMGGKKLQNALAQTAVAMGKINENAVKGTKSGEQLTIMGASFRDSIMAKPGQTSWLTSDILVNTLATMDGRFSEAALAAEKTETGLQKYSKAQIQARIETARTNLEQKNGVKFTDEQFAALQKMSTSAFKAATEVKTLGQVFDVAKETIGSGWSASFRNIFGDLKDAKALFTPMSNGLNDIINANALARNQILDIWNRKGGRADVIEGLKNSWQAVWSIIQAVGKGFRDIFPRSTGKDLLNASESFREFTKTLIPGKDTLEDIRSIAGGVASVFSIVKQVLGGFITGIKTIFEVVGGGNGAFLDFGASLGEMLKNFDAFLKKSGVITEFFTGLGGLLSVPISLLQGIASAFASIFEGFSIGKAEATAGAIGDASKSLGGLSSAASGIRAFFEGLTAMFSNLGEAIGKGLVNIGDFIASFLTSDSFAPAIDAINTGLFAAITAAIVSFLKGGPSVDLTGGLFSNVAASLEAATGALTAMQTDLKANALLKIGGAIAVLAGALFLLSTIDPGDLRKALAAMTAGFGVLIGALVVLLKYAGPAGIFQIYAVSSALAKMAFSILLMAGALKILSSINFGDMLRGLVGLAAALFIMQKALIPMAANSKGMIKAAAALILVGIAINILAVALKIFASMSWGEMIKGLAGLTGVLLALTIGLKRMPELNTEAITLIALAVAINILAVALKIFATMSWVEMAKGLLMLAGALGVISVAMGMMPKKMLFQAIALNAVASAMVILAGALKIMGRMGWEEIAKGMVVLGGALAILAVGLRAIGVVGTIGSIGLLAAAGALAVLMPVILALGAMSWENIIKSMTVLAGVFLIFGIAGYALAPVTPVLIGLGAALILFGAGLALAGAGALAAATAFGIIVAAGIAGATVLATVLQTIIQSIPPAMAAFGRGVVQFAVAIGQGAPRIAQAFGRVLSNMIDAVIRNTPKLARMFLVMLNAAIRVVVVAIPRIVDAGLRLIVGFLGAISRNVPKIVNLAADIIVKFLDGISRNLDRIIQSGVRLILAFIRGVAQAIRQNSEAMGAAGADLGLAMVEGIAGGISGAAGRIKDAALGAAREAFDAARDFFRMKSPSKLMRDEVGVMIMRGWAKGMNDAAPEVSGEMKAAGRTAMSTLKTTLSGIDDAFALDPSLNPTVTPVLDLSALTREANKMSSILATSPITAGVSYMAAADISSATQDDGPDDGPAGSGGGDTYLTYEQHLHSPTPLDSVTVYRGSRSLLAMKKEELAP